MANESRPRILLADDFPPLLVAWRRLLTPFYDVVGELSGGQSLLEAAMTLDPDVMILDLSMPELNGLTGCREIMNGASRSKIVLVTAAADPNITSAAIRAGASAFVRKETAVPDLLTAIEAVLAGTTYCSSFPAHSQTV
jgi:DNA-binding NarL/FixJ family response regulator